jgi:hypothetical protein
MAKTEKSSSPKFAEGGSTSGMQTRQGVNTQTPGGTGRKYGGKGGKWAEGGPASGMHARGTVTTRHPGGTGGQS